MRQINYIKIKSLNHKINRKAMIKSQIDFQLERAEEGWGWEVVDTLYEAFAETLHATIGDEVSPYPSITGAMWQCEDDNVSPCLTHWRHRNGLVYPRKEEK